MDVTAPHITLLLNVLMLLSAFLICCRTQRADFPRVDGNRLQFFDLESITVHCEHVDGLSEWRVMRKLEAEANSSRWDQSSGSETIRAAFTSDSGQYWCENQDGERSRSLNITVTSGDVILQSPAAAVMEGDTVTLVCRHRFTPKLSADFYKDGVLLKTGYDGEHVMDSVSAADEGLYSCSISGSGSSPESWLNVRDRTFLTPSPPPETSPPPPVHGSIFTPAVVCVFVAVPLVLVLVLVVGLLCCHKHKVCCFSSKASTNTESGEDKVTYATVHHHKKKESGEDNVTYATVHHHKKKAGKAASSASERRNRSCTDKSSIYSALK